MRNSESVSMSILTLRSVTNLRSKILLIYYTWTNAWSSLLLSYTGPKLMFLFTILTNCPAFRGTVPIFGPKFAAVPLFILSVPLFLLFFWGTNLSLNLIIFSHIYQICKNVPLLDLKSRFFRKFVPLFASCRLVGMINRLFYWHNYYYVLLAKLYVVTDIVVSHEQTTVAFNFWITNTVPNPIPACVVITGASWSHGNSPFFCPRVHHSQEYMIEMGRWVLITLALVWLPSLPMVQQWSNV